MASSRQEVVDFASVEEDDYQPSYDELRAEAALHAKLRAESFQKAAKAHGQKQYSLAQFYAQQVSCEMCKIVCPRLRVKSSGSHVHVRL